MKVKRHFAPDMKTALRLVREEQGPDAVILSTRHTDGGVEVISALEFDPEPAAAPAEPAMTVGSPGSQGAGSLWGHEGPPATDVMQSSVAAPAAVEWSQDPLLREMKSELATLRDLVQYQFGQLAGQGLRERDPVRVHLRRRLRRLGLSARVAATLARRVSATRSDRAWQEALRLLTRWIPVFERDPLAEGGVIALAGATGVGKTTTIAKLAARFVRRHGPEHLALVTTDNFRVGAESQLSAYAQILGVPVHRAADAATLQGLLQALSDRRLVLIDTAGLGSGERRVQAVHELLASSRRIRTFLVAAASTQPRALEQVIAALPEGLLDGSVLTKLDEVPGPAEVLSVLVEKRLPLAWTCAGPQVPQDLARARPEDLVARIVAAEPAPVAPHRQHDRLREQVAASARGVGV
ncbi:MAG: flagellar biosynthesis protein FlhF [Gammaproteobacteria bacterium]|nr:MAG: flagellar biosynthesis protein FlhF [Gammaproteobacteria bacterium]